MQRTFANKPFYRTGGICNPHKRYKRSLPPQITVPIPNILKGNRKRKKRNKEFQGLLVLSSQHFKLKALAAFYCCACIFPYFSCCRFLVLDIQIWMSIWPYFTLSCLLLLLLAGSKAWSGKNSSIWTFFFLLHAFYAQIMLLPLIYAGTFVNSFWSLLLSFIRLKCQLNCCANVQKGGNLLI